MKKQVLSLALSATMLASMLPKPAFAADNTTFPDMPNDWSTQALQNAINNGLLNGIDGKIAASENLTRAQMAAIVTRAFGTNGKADISSFGDVNTGDWFYDAMASSVLMGAFQGDGVNLNPNANITRQEAFTVLARLFTLSGGDQSVLSSYTDGAQVADWAKDSMASMVAAGYVKGSDNKLNPLSSITRAEFAQVMDNLVKTYFADSQLNVNADGNAVLNKAGTLEGATISGDLIIGDGAAEGDVVLKDVTVSGRLLVRGGGTSTVTLEGNTTVGSVVVNKPTGAVRVENNTEKTVNVNAVSDNVVLTGDFNEVNANAVQGTVTLTGATVATMNVTGTSAKMVVSEKSTVETMNVAQSASGTAVSVQSGTTVKTMNTAASKAVVTVNGTVGTMSVSGSDTTVKAEEGAKIEKITTSAANTTVSGKGSVTNFEAAQGASGADITTDGTKVVNNGTGNVTTGNDKVIASGSTGTSQSDSTTPGGGGSIGGEDEGTPILPVGGIIGVKPVDQSGEGAIAPEKMPTVTASATQDIVSKVVTIKLSTDKEVPLHQNEEKAEGYWVGVAVEVPDDVSEINYYFGTTANATTDKKTSPTVDPTIGDKKYFVAFVNAGAVAPKTHLTLQWGDNEAVQYVIDLSGVKVDMEKATASAVSVYDEAYAPTGITRDADNELDLTKSKTMTQLEVENFDNAGDANKDTRRAMVNYIKVTGVASSKNIEKVAYSVNRDGKVASAEETVENLKRDGRFVKGEDGSIYLKLGITFAEKKDSTWTKLGTDKYVVTLDFKTSEGATTRASYTLDISKLNITAPATEGDTLPTADDWKFISSFTLTADCTLETGYDVPENKTLVIAEDGFLDAYDVALSGAGSVVVKGGTLKINANYNNGEGNKVPTVATIQVNHGGTLASMTTNVEEEAADTKFVGPGADARIQTTEGASVTFKLGSLGEGSKPTMTIAGNVIIPKGQTWYSMFDSDKEALGIDMTQESGTMTVDGTLKIVSANKTGSSLTINENASVVVNGTMSVAAFGTVTNNGTIENNGTIDGSDKVEGADVTLEQSTLPVFPKFVDKGTEKVWINDGWFEVTEQKANTRVDGPAKDGTPSFEYGNTYTSAGVTFADNAIKVAVDATKAFLADSETNAQAIENLTQPSGELNPDGSVNGLFFGVQFEAPESAEKVTVYRSTGGAEAKNLGQNNAAFDLTQETVYGGADTYDGDFINYLVFAEANAEADYIGDNTWSYTFVWQNADDDVIGVSQSTITRTLAE